MKVLIIKNISNQKLWKEQNRNCLPYLLGIYVILNLWVGFVKILISVNCHYLQLTCCACSQCTHLITLREIFA